MPYALENHTEIFARSERKKFHKNFKRAALLVAVMFVGGCAQHDVTHPSTVSKIEANGTGEPLVLTNPNSADAKAFSASDHELSATDYRKSEAAGPEPIWDRMQNKNDKKLEVAREDEVGNEVAQDGSAQGAGASDGAAPGEAGKFANPSLSDEPPMRHTFLSHRATTHPTSNPTTHPVVIHEADLPAQITDTPDGKVRIIWNLRNFGGSTVAVATDGDTQRRTVTATPPDLTPLVTTVTQQAGVGATVVPLPAENTLVVTCEKGNKDSVLALLKDLDVPPRQVEITAKIFEVSHDFDYQQGADFLVNHLGATGTQTGGSTFDTQKLLQAASSATPYQGSVVDLMKTFQSAGVSIDTSFQLLAEAGLIKVVSSPRMTVAEGQTGYMLAGQELPIQSSSIAAATTSITTTYKPVGVQLYITPQVISDDRIKLHAISIVSSVSGFQQLPTLEGGTTVDGSTGALLNPILDSREAETAVTIADRSTLVISGMRMVRTTTRENKIPGLGDIPGLGWMFKNHRSQQQVTDLYFFVTPTLL